MASKIGALMQRRVAIDVDPERSAVGVIVHGDVQVLDRAQRQIVRCGAMAGEAEAVIERHDVDAQPEQRPAIGVAAANVPAHVRQRIALMRQT